MAVCAAQVQGQRQKRRSDEGNGKKRPRLHRDRLRDGGEGDCVGKSMKMVRRGAGARYIG